jgi:Ca2+:H+ antiporter
LATPANIAYALLFGAPTFASYLLVAAVLFCVGGWVMARVCLSLGRYFLWPFGKYLEKLDPPRPQLTSARAATQQEPRSRRWDPGWSSLYAKVTWFLFAAPLLSLAHAVVALFSWLLVFFVPMAKAHFVAIKSIWSHPTAMRVGGGGPPLYSEVLHCAYSAASAYYYKYAIHGLNIVLLNSLIIVLGTLVPPPPPLQWPLVQILSL